MSSRRRQIQHRLRADHVDEIGLHAANLALESGEEEDRAAIVGRQQARARAQVGEAEIGDLAGRRVEAGIELLEDRGAARLRQARIQLEQNPEAAVFAGQLGNPVRLSEGRVEIGQRLM